MDLVVVGTGHPSAHSAAICMACIDVFLMENMRFVVNEANSIHGIHRRRHVFPGNGRPGPGSLNDISTSPPLFYAE
ncbi:hypothetical protein CN225_19180 [Sinorhizobium meliloti]|nr:hypothetical protein CN225_19180 [Sinorhizobium meliloti]